jgi:hypothetical protein
MGIKYQFTYRWHFHSECSYNEFLTSFLPSIPLTTQQTWRIKIPWRAYLQEVGFGMLWIRSERTDSDKRSLVSSKLTSASYPRDHAASGRHDGQERREGNTGSHNCQFSGVQNGDQTRLRSLCNCIIFSIPLRVCLGRSQVRMLCAVGLRWVTTPTTSH